MAIERFIAPRFKPGMVIDLSYKTNLLPNRIMIKTIMMREFDKGWVYDVILESTGECAIMEEKFILERMSNKSSYVYKHEYIKNLYNNGFRFCGNYTKTEARNVANSFINLENINNIQIHTGYTSQGNREANRYGVWIRYNMIIMDNGTLCRSKDRDKKPEVIVIK